MKKVKFKLKMLLSRNFVFSLQTFWGFCQVQNFTFLLQIQHDNNFLPTSKHRQAKLRRFLGVSNEAPSWLLSQNS